MRENSVFQSKDQRSIERGKSFKLYGFILIPGSLAMAIASL